MIAKRRAGGRSRRSGRLCAAVLLMGACAVALAQERVREESVDAQRAQAELQQKIDAVDDATRKALGELRSIEREAGRLRAYNDELEPLVARQAQTIAQREASLEALSETREALPVLMRHLVERLYQLIEADLPFLREERLARVDALAAMLADGEMQPADKLDRLLSAWRTELGYGRNLDSWRDKLVGAKAREVEYLRLGRLGLYYLTPDGDTGGVWHAATGDWQPLNNAQRAEVRKGLRIAREQRAPELLALPVSVEVSREQGHEETS